MDVVIAGGHGHVGLRLLRLLADHGHRGRGIVRDEAQSQDLEAVGAEALVCDLESAEVVGRCAMPTPSSSPPDLARGAGPSASARSTTARP
jgi:nucleoside-diphosphate-sugar epimerase